MFGHTNTDIIPLYLIDFSLSSKSKAVLWLTQSFTSLSSTLPAALQSFFLDWGRFSPTPLKDYRLEGRKRWPVLESWVSPQSVGRAILQRSMWTKQSFWCKKNRIIVVEQLWKKVFCCTCCEQGPCFNYVWSLVANIQSPSKGGKRTSIFFSIHLAGRLFQVFDTLTFCSLWMRPGYTYRVSLDWLRAVESGFIQCFKHSPQCSVSASNSSL